MLNYLWAFMMLVGVLWGAFHGNLNGVTDGALTSAKEAVMLCITMLGIMSFWSGIMEVGRKSGLIERMSQKMSPILRFLFPRIPDDHPALEYISTNIIANILGLGWAATPAGLKAMEALKELEEKRRKGEVSGKYSLKPVPEGTANNEMCTFLIINISSLQLIPVNMIAYRSQYGSLNPMAVVGPALIATLISTIVGVAACKLMDR
ncbi:MAG TPA: nucleoside recognition protein [Lachnoclostridium sp.]|jgi:spore maturation protein A|uniref:nucleoside recognition domain-containing protein n=1 Tax=Lacrimispora sp. TaxID=2719234 RepID=UPI000ED0BC5C|nr:nucleoside recognition domain-containing protein [Lacrimispora sp.]HCD45230.1 nucleoside recognition protein [Lachnoclostridium sp.]